MKPLLVFVAGLLVFSGGGLQGRLGSVLAAFIDPGALVEVSPTNNQAPGPTKDVPGGQVPGHGNGNTNKANCIAAGGTWSGPNETEGKCTLPA